MMNQVIDNTLIIPIYVAVQHKKEKNMFTYSQVKEFWSNYFKSLEQFTKDWQKDVLETFKK